MTWDRARPKAASLRDLDGDPLVGVDGRGVVVGGDAHHPGALVARLVDEVDVRDLRVGGIAAPDQDQVGVEEIVARARDGDLAEGGHGARVVVADLAVHVEHGRVEQETGAVGAHAAAAVGGGGARIPDDRFGAVLAQRVDGAIGDLAQPLLPRDALPLPLAAAPDAAQGMAQPRGVVHGLAVTRSLVAAAGVEVRHARVGLLVVGGLLLAEHDPILYEHVPVAAALVPAVDVMRALGDPIPGPLVAVEVAPVAVARGTGGRLRLGRGGRFGLRAQAQQGEGEPERSRTDQESPARQPAHRHPRSEGGARRPAGLCAAPRRAA